MFRDQRGCRLLQLDNVSIISLLIRRLKLLDLRVTDKDRGHTLGIAQIVQPVDEFPPVPERLNESLSEPRLLD